jgi:hypothetical protein
MLLPIQAPAPWTEGDEFARFIRDDLPMTESYSQILTTHLQSMNSELRSVLPIIDRVHLLMMRYLQRSGWIDDGN